MQKVLLIHGFEGSSQGNFFPWLRSVLEAKGFEILAPDLPNPKHPQFEKDLSFLLKQAEQLSPRDFVLGHSLGAFYAAHLAARVPLAACVLIAPALFPLDFDHFRGIWKESDIDALEQVLSHPVSWRDIQAKARLAIFSDDDPYIPIEHAQELDSSWEVKILHGKKHLQAGEIPELLECIKFGA